MGSGRAGRPPGPAKGPSPHRPHRRDDAGHTTGSCRGAPRLGARGRCGNRATGRQRHRLTAAGDNGSPGRLLGYCVGQKARPAAHNEEDGVDIPADETIHECVIDVHMHTVDSDPKSPLFVTIRSQGRSDESVRTRTQHVFDVLTMGRKTFVRMPLRVEEHADSESHTRCWRGYVRFSVYNEIGEHKVASSIPEMMGMGAPTDA